MSAAEPSVENPRARAAVPWVPRPAEPYEPGNLAALKHGATSPRQVGPLMERILELLPAVAPWTSRPAFTGACRSLARTEAQLLLLEAWLDEQAILRAEGADELEPQPRAALKLLHDLENRAKGLRLELGLTPQSLAKLLASLAAVASSSGDESGLEALKAEGRAIVAAREGDGQGSDQGKQDHAGE